jgi:hypothetical protein
MKRICGEPIALHGARRVPDHSSNSASPISARRSRIAAWIRSRTRTFEADPGTDDQQAEARLAQ